MLLPENTCKKFLMKKTLNLKQKKISEKASLAKLAHLNAPVKFILLERIKLTLQLKGCHINSWKNKY